MMTGQSLLLRAVTLALLIFSAASGFCAEATEQVLWTIGKVDNSTLEFNNKWDFAAGGNPEFVAGKSDPRKDWSGFHPGSRDAEHGSRPHPFVVSFDLPKPPAGVFYLTLDLLFKSAGVPQYVVEINGHKGKFFPTPTLSEEIGDPETAWNIVFSRQHLVLALPASYFQEGSNRLVLTCLDDNSEPILGPKNPTGGESGVYYDALKLTNDPQATPSTAVDIGAVPTIFYRRSGSGLREIVTLKASAMQPLQHGSATLTLAGKPYSCDLNSDYEFGEAACAVQVPEFKDSVSAELAIHAGAAGAEKTLQLAAARKWKLFLAPQIHLDMGYTDYRPMSYEVHLRNMDGIVTALEKNKTLKFDPDGAFIYTDYWQNRVSGNA